MIRMYSKRLLMPFVGVIQVAEMGRARALSADGENLAIQYALSEDTHRRISKHVDDPSSHYSFVATIEQGRLETRAVHPFLDPDDVRSAIHQLYDAVIDARLPFAAADRYEYWLLDATTTDPSRCCSPASTNKTWPCRPRARCGSPCPRHSSTCGHRNRLRTPMCPPVNYRLQKLVEERAGTKLRVAWFERPDPTTDDFPPCLIREDWDSEERQQLCDPYIQRLAPSLLMMHSLSQPDRHRLEQGARDYVFDVERFYSLYPEVIDTSFLTTARVEARVRRAAER